MIDFANFSNNLSKDTSVWFLHSHPDDESYLTGGLIQHFISQGYSTHLVYLSANQCSSKPLSTLRQQEATLASCFLGLTNIHFLPYCEDGCNNLLHKRIGNASSLLVAENICALADTDTLNKLFLSYDKKGGYGHPDHLALHNVGCSLACLGYRVVEVSMNWNSFSSWIENSKIIGLSKKLLPLESYWCSNPWLQKDDIIYSYCLTPLELLNKKKALLSHASQMPPDEFPGGLSDEDFHNVFGIEYLTGIIKESQL